MKVSKQEFRKIMLFGLAVRKVCNNGKENKQYLFECPLCGGMAAGMKRNDGYIGKCYGCGMKI